MERTADAAGCTIFDKSGRILLVHQVYGKKKWALPGGVVENGESSWEAAVRECREEIQIEVTDMSLSGLYFLSHRNAYVFIFRANSFSGIPTPDGIEIDEYAYFDLHDLPKPMSNFTIQRIQDAALFEKNVYMREQHVNTYVIE
ncbi:NUDIX hydrolase [Paenibacillus radicis (ex Xue et al. 2023)]|uniref:NUDIX domain-containing protein n=1 Tax=Paenibacillus radicis (ex Xue et al. 2023) TaxID=2972489 RepID=A0ABT1YB04_9BACL|nr:NUDIX domain-containing protein [Paenibacillus radicis (ex Xue et al. 2023)]MCR8630362.1 NUDIX domain-containing protein [Paenibacillus radicis (ex Xue et al. 2023)]